MTNEREELAREIFVADNANALHPEAEWKAAGDRNRRYAYNIADGLIAAGYRKEPTP